MIVDEELSDEVAQEIPIKGNFQTAYDFEQEAKKKKQKMSSEEKEEKQLAKAMLSKKKQNLLRCMDHNKDKKKKSIEKLKEKAKLNQKKKAVGK